jgi:hypothetical protein
MLGAAPRPLSGLMQHPTLGQVRYSIAEVSDVPDEQVEATIDLMRQYVIEDAAGSEIQADTTRAIASGGTGEPLSDTWEYLRRDGRRGMRFVRDESTGAPFEASQDFQPGGWRPVVETLMRPADQVLIATPQGDCDDFAMYGAAHLRAQGVPVSFATVGADPREPEVYSHIYLVAYPETGPYAGQRVPIDLSHGPYLGWEVPGAQNLKYREWPLQAGLGVFELGVIAAAAYLLYRAVARRPN